MGFYGFEEMNYFWAKAAFLFINITPSGLAVCVLAGCYNHFNPSGLL